MKIHGELKGLTRIGCIAGFWGSRTRPHSTLTVATARDVHTGELFRFLEFASFALPFTDLIIGVDAGRRQRRIRG